LLERLFALETAGIKLGLDNITRLCGALGHPERSFTSLHVAGTNGKGSVTAMTHAALAAAGLRAARFTSPHLVDLNERFVIGLEPVDTATLEDAAGHVLRCADGLRAEGVLTVLPTFFEATTAVAFELFRRAGVEVAVIEVGLGGRFDSTNVIAPPVGAITTIGLDHQQYLGDTIESIAYEKAGIVKPGMTVVIGRLPDEARRVVERVAAERGARVVAAAARATVDAAMADGRAVVTIDTPVDRYGPLTLALRGAHQIDNAAVAVCLLEAAQDAGIVVRGDAIERGLSTAVWPARLELVAAGEGRILIDAAHNVDGARALAAHLARWHPARPALVIGMMRDKDARGILEALLPATAAVFTTAASTPRAMPADELARQVSAVDPARSVRVEPDPMRALDAALGAADTVCVAGSLFVAGEVREGLRQRAMLR
jgi:dihydrofolate synthase/folylpolyglutamate synthase